MTCNTPPGVWGRDVPSAAWSQPDPTSCSQLGQMTCLLLVPKKYLYQNSFRYMVSKGEGEKSFFCTSYCLCCFYLFFGGGWRNLHTSFCSLHLQLITMSTLGGLRSQAGEVFPCWQSSPKKVICMPVCFALLHALSSNFLLCFRLPLLFACSFSQLRPHLLGSLASLSPYKVKCSMPSLL